ncbi:Alpha/Beta hydrolase protein [Elsinoe ampelina]|uniref:Alpha/Beta hydrolase protein n=1 Tax=Elsinoe ampelina TaxID=302913 RepID=A0A6A6GMI9_9PEZI|nr:Alpha/Beta hydrolase protein [Elsinoe ampelina]
MASFEFLKRRDMTATDGGAGAPSPPNQSSTSYQPFIDTAAATCTLPDGRKIGYTQYGSPTGQPIFFLHGLPGSRIEAAHLDEAGKRHNARVIGIDRPGIGLSTAQPGRTVVSAAQDVDRLATHLDIPCYGVLGVSGGGPPALACAATLPPDRLKAVSIVCGLGLGGMPLTGMGWMNWLGFRFGWHWMPTLSAKYVEREGFLGLPEEERYRLAEKKFSSFKDPRDREAFVNPGGILPVFLTSIKEAFRQGTSGVATEGWTLVQPAGFEIEDIRKDLPVQLWYGKDDKNVGMVGGLIAKRLGERGNVRYHLTDDTHASIFTRNKDGFVRELVQSMAD